MLFLRSLALLSLACFATAQTQRARAKRLTEHRRDHYERRVKRELAQQLTFEEEFHNACPSPETACPTGAGFECLDLRQTLDSCGACNWNCGTAHPNAKSISCAEGACIIHSCKPGFSFDNEARTCA